MSDSQIVEKGLDLRPGGRFACRRSCVAQETWELNCTLGTRERGILALVACATMIELFIILLVGFALGYMCAVNTERAQVNSTSINVVPGSPVPGPESARQVSSGSGVQSQGVSRRTIATQSQCTYKRKILTPRFHVLPNLADGVSDVTFAD